MNWQAWSVVIAGFGLMLGALGFIHARTDAQRRERHEAEARLWSELNALKADAVKRGDMMPHIDRLERAIADLRAEIGGAIRDLNNHLIKFVGGRAGE